MKFIKSILIFSIFLSCRSDKISEKSIELNNQAINSISNEKYDDALKFANEAIIEDENNYNAYTIKAQMLIKKNKLNEAIKVVEEQLEIKPAFAEGWTFKGLINDLNGNQKQANIDYYKSIELFQKRNQNNESNTKLNDTNTYVSLILIGDEKSKIKMSELENKYKGDRSTYSLMLSFKKHGKKELIEQMFIK